MNGGLVSLEEIAATSLFGGSNSRCEMWWVSHSGQRPNQTGNPPQENSSLLCLFLQLLHSKHCCNTWNFQNPSGDIRNISSISIWTFKKKKKMWNSKNFQSCLKWESDKKRNLIMKPFIFLENFTWIPTLHLFPRIPVLDQNIFREKHWWSKEIQTRNLEFCIWVFHCSLLWETWILRNETPIRVTA